MKKFFKATENFFWSSASYSVDTACLKAKFEFWFSLLSVGNLPMLKSCYCSNIWDDLYM